MINLKEKQTKLRFIAEINEDTLKAPVSHDKFSFLSGKIGIRLGLYIYIFKFL